MLISQSIPVSPMLRHVETLCFTALRPRGNHASPKPPCFRSLSKSLPSRRAEDMAMAQCIRLCSDCADAVVNASQCITTRHLFERIVASVMDALQLGGGVHASRSSLVPAAPARIQRRCETLAQLSITLSAMLKEPTRDPRWRFVLVLDAIDKQRDAPLTLLPGLARLSETVSLQAPTYIYALLYTLYTGRYKPMTHDTCEIPLLRDAANRCCSRYNRFPALPQSSSSPLRLRLFSALPPRRIFASPPIRNLNSSASWPFHHPRPFPD